ncbi:MAG: hypothetical protein WAM28_00980 [Chlamydiales bacterium]
MSRVSCFLFLLSLFCGACISPNRIPPDKIVSINIIDRNGMSEIISSRDRLDGFEKTDFLSSQPYQKVMRVYGREKNGDVNSRITSYHPNGQVKQYLEATNNSASGTYQEWFSNGQLKVEASLVGGVADINTMAEETWLFDGINRAWDEDGNLIAEIHYYKGELEGTSFYYHPNGKVWKEIPFEKNKIHGIQKIFLDDGTLFQTADFNGGLKEGLSIRYWEPSKVACYEQFEKGLLKEGEYFSSEEEVVSEIKKGKGFRALFGEKELHQLQEYQNGIQEGAVKVYDEEQALAQLYSLKDGEKNGEEIYYFPGSSQPKLLLNWEGGILNGPVKTWYENGNLESQREMSQNKKNGLLTVWYRNGALAFVEEYESDHLIKGEYYRKGEKAPLSIVEKGRGVASLFNAEGVFSRKVHYKDGKPVE